MQFNNSMWTAIGYPKSFLEKHMYADQKKFEIWTTCMKFLLLNLQSKQDVASNLKGDRWANAVEIKSYTPYLTSVFSSWQVISIQTKGEISEFPSSMCTYKFGFSCSNSFNWRDYQTTLSTNEGTSKLVWKGINEDNL